MTFGIWKFLHLLGMALWLGGMLTLSIWTSRARATGEAEIIAFAYTSARRLYRSVVSIGAWMSLVAGVLLMLLTDRPWFRPTPEHWLFQMQVLGLVTFLLTILYVVPNAGRLARLAEGVRGGEALSPEFAARVKRNSIVGSAVGGVLVYMVLLGALRF